MCVCRMRVTTPVYPPPPAVMIYTFGPVHHMESQR